MSISPSKFICREPEAEVHPHAFASYPHPDDRPIVRREEHDRCFPVPLDMFSNLGRVLERLWQPALLIVIQGQSRGFGFVEIREQPGAQNAIFHLNGAERPGHHERERSATEADR